MQESKNLSEQKAFTVKEISMMALENDGKNRDADKWINQTPAEFEVSLETLIHLGLFKESARDLLDSIGDTPLALNDIEERIDTRNSLLSKQEANKRRREADEMAILESNGEIRAFHADIKVAYKNGQIFVRRAAQNETEAAELKRTIAKHFDAGVAAGLATSTVPPKPKPRFQLLRTWELFAFCLNRKTKQEVFEPLLDELKEDYLLAQRYRTPWAKRWLQFCFTLKTLAMVGGCLRVSISSKIVKLLLCFVPEAVRRFFSN
jgi:hypothetical protein